MNTFSTGKIELLPLVASALGVIAGIVLLLMGTYHLSGKNCNESLSLVMLLPTVWAAVKLIQCFLSYTTVSVVSTDMLDLICYGTIALFLLAVGMVIGNVESIVTDKFNLTKTLNIRTQQNFGSIHYVTVLKVKE